MKDEFPPFFFSISFKQLEDVLLEE